MDNMTTKPALWKVVREWWMACICPVLNLVLWKGTLQDLLCDIKSVLIWWCLRQFALRPHDLEPLNYSDGRPTRKHEHLVRNFFIGLFNTYHSKLRYNFSPPKKGRKHVCQTLPQSTKKWMDTRDDRMFINFVWSIWIHAHSIFKGNTFWYLQYLPTCYWMKAVDSWSKILEMKWRETTTTNSILL